MKLTRKELLSVPHLRAIEVERLRSTGITGVSTDSRTTGKGNIFVALRGERFDGHEFVLQALDGGASCVVVEPAWFDSNVAFLAAKAVPTLVVENTTLALGDLARMYRKRFKLPVLAVGGSNGKTTTKEMIAAVLRTTHRVLCTEGNQNNQIGVPQTLFRLQKSHDVAVLEFGTNHPGEIEYLCRVAEPTHGLITNIGHEHLEFFGGLEGVATAEGELFRWLGSMRSRRAVAVVNGDDARVTQQAKHVKRRFRYGFEARAVDLKGTLLTIDAHGRPGVRMKPKSGKGVDIRVPVPGHHNAVNALAAAAVGMCFKVPLPKIKSAIERFSAVTNRTQVLTIGGVTVVNDTYNSNVDSALAALRTLAVMQTDGKRIAVLADMLELGAHAEGAHRSVGEAAGELGVDYLLTFGPLSRWTHEAATVKHKTHYEQKNILAEYVAELVSPGDVVLVKGSRGMKMEDVVTFLEERLQRAT
jgi:UDP-N-acetylmuramoyl-tripeptide--D-alanyl-D-alanine ligase